VIDRLRDPVVFSATTLAVEPHAAQLPYLLDQSHPVKVLLGGRRSGKSYALAVEAAFHAVRAIRERRPFRQLIVAPARDQAKLLLDRITALISASPLGGIVESEVASPFPQVTLTGGSVIFVRAASEGGRLLRGHSADRALVDEAGYLAPETITEGLAPVLSDSGGTLVLASTATSSGTWLHRTFESGARGDARVSSYRMLTLQNPHVDAAYVRAQREALTERAWLREYEGQFSDTTERVFAWDGVIACASGDEEGPQPGHRYTIGWDPAARKDKSAIAVLDVTAKPWRVVKMLDVRGSDYVEQVATVVALAQEYCGARIILDGTGHGAVLADLVRRHGVSFEAVVFTSESKSRLVMNLAVAIERREITFPALRDLLDEFARYEARTGPTGVTRFGAAGRAYDDAITAMGLALRGVSVAATAQAFAEGRLPPFIRGATPTAFGADAVFEAGGLPSEWHPFGWR
jgi:hypothetical protein